MTKPALIFDWRVKESSFRLKMVSYLIVGVTFAFFLGAFQIRIPTSEQKRSEAASVIRFVDEAMARSWLVVAEESGPFPGGLELGEDWNVLTATGDDGLFQWSDYKSALRPLPDDTGRSYEALSAKGVRVYPARKKPEKPEQVAARKVRLAPILIPYDSAAVAWMPDGLPNFQMPAETATGTAPWRFTVNLRENGSVRDVVSLEGGTDSVQSAMERWLRGVQFKEGQGDRWLGLRVEFVNLPDDGTEPQ